ncbi:MAG: nuclear transport factor 2 family protein [Burkholderiales bacterium]|nr:nuclear transport factor 2 family protein [Burkholderiales bacterium]
MDREQAVTRIVQLFETLAPQDVARLGEFYMPDAWFKDPFHEVRGLGEVQRIFAHMFEALQAPRFIVTARIVQGDQCFLAWEFRFAFRSWRRGREQVVRGGSHLGLAADGRVAWHRDYWDAAEELYGKLPLLGGLMRWLARRAAA